MSIDTYTLPAHANVVPDPIRALYRSGGFDKAVRDWHLARIPRYTANSVKMIKCPYCSKWKDRRSMQIDHIIPAKVYCRWYMLGKSKHIAEHPQYASAHLKNAYSAKSNLVLSCMRCNSSGQDKIMDQADFILAENRVMSYAAALRLHESWATLQKINTNLRFKHVAGGTLKRFVMEGVWWSLRTTRNTKKKTGSTSTETKLIRSLEIIEAAIIIHLVRSRPAWLVTNVELEADQPTQNLANEELRLCYYCLGLFKKQAFQVDHINPASMRSDVPAIYNDPTNLIPVCRTCNTSKSNAYLSTSWLDAQIAKRQTEGLPGVEHATNLVVPPGHADAVAYGRACRQIVLGR